MKYFKVTYITESAKRKDVGVISAANAEVAFWTALKVCEDRPAYKKSAWMVGDIELIH